VRLRERLRGLGGFRLWSWLPLVLAAVYAISLLSNLDSLVRALYLTSDQASAPYLGELYRQAPPGAEVVLGRFPWYTTLWFESLTAGLPAHRQLWEVGPWITSLLGVALLAWSTAKAAGRWAAAMVAVLLACASPVLLSLQFYWSGHAWTPVHVCVLGAFLVLLATRRGVLGTHWVAHWLACAGVAAFTAAGLASDPLLGPAGLAPFALAGIAMVWLLGAPTGRRVAISAIVVAAVSAIGAVLIDQAMVAARIGALPGFSIPFSRYDHLAGNVGRLGKDLLLVFNGDFAGAPLTARSVLALACAIVAAAAVVACTRFARAWLGVALRAARATGLRAGAEAAEAAHLAFWVTSAATLSAGLVLTTLVGKHDSSRYMVSVAYAVPAVLAVAAARRQWARGLVAAGACVIVAGSIGGLWRGDIAATAARAYPTGRAAGPLARLARSEHLKYGYARYADAAPLTWLTKAAVQVYPVAPCRHAQALCPWAFHRISSWYSPRPSTRTFVLTDVLPRRAISSLGRPVQVAKVGGLTVYVYAYDVAARLARCDAPNAGTRCPS
jgi:hypothetical protein